MTRRKIIWLIAGGFAVVTAAVASLVAFTNGVLFFLRRRLVPTIDEPAAFSALAVFQILLSV